LFFVFCVFFLKGFSQDFEFIENLSKDKISFELVNNLVIIPVAINGKELSFILDSGSRNTLLFSLTNIDSLQINEATPIKIRGLGDEGLVDALKSKGNTLTIGDAISENQTLYIVFDKKVNISPKMGIPIHGIIGYEFFKNFTVETNYITKKLKFYKPDTYTKKKCKKCREIPLRFVKNRPYVDAKGYHENKPKALNLLVDTGSSDALWLFDSQFGIDENSKNYFEDFLGYGISGNIYGKKSKLTKFTLGAMDFDQVKVSYPDTTVITRLFMEAGRDGSIGGEIFRRFHVVMDYANKKMILKPNRYYHDPFYYNMAGITLEHDGMVSVRGFESDGVVALEAKNNVSIAGAVEIMVNPRFSVFMAPRYVVTEVRKGSPAARAGIIKGDVVISVNGKESYKYKLYELNTLFSDNKAGRKMKFLIKRNGIEMRFNFVLEKVL